MSTPAESSYLDGQSSGHEYAGGVPFLTGGAPAPNRIDARLATRPPDPTRVPLGAHARGWLRDAWSIGWLQVRHSLGLTMSYKPHLVTPPLQEGIPPVNPQPRVEGWRSNEPWDSPYVVTP